MVLALVRLMMSTLMRPTTTAVPITPYMWKLSKRNISWMRNQLTISAFTKTMPNRMPQAAYFRLCHHGCTSSLSLTQIASSSRASGRVQYAVGGC
jgi:hypothetical protein